MNRIEPVAMVSEAPAMTLAELAGKINTEHERVEAAAKMGLQHAKAAGEMLSQAKRQVGHGNWLAWIREHCRASVRTVQAYIRVAQRWDELTAKSATGVAHLGFREGLKLLADDTDDDVVGLTPEGQMALDHGLISADAARHLLRLSVYDRLATQPCDFKDSWTDLQAKKILWRPRFARSEEQIAFEVDSHLYDLIAVEMDFAQLPPADAEQKCSADLKDPGRDEHGLAPAYYFAFLWQFMRPDYSRLTVEDRLMIEQATDQYLSPDFYPRSIKEWRADKEWGTITPLVQSPEADEE